jgi:hypothetical protein
MNVKGSRRDIFSQVGLLGKNAALITIPLESFGNINKSERCRKEAQVRNLLLHYN